MASELTVADVCGSSGDGGSGGGGYYASGCILDVELQVAIKAGLKKE